MNVKIEIDGYEIISTGTVMTVEGKKLLFTIEDLKYELEFKDNTETTEPMISSNVIIDGKGLEIFFENFNNSLGAGNVEPIELGKVGDRKILLIYRVYALTASKSKIFHYTWLLEKGSENV